MEIKNVLYVSDDLDQNLGGDGFTLSRLLGGDNTPSPQTQAWEGLSVPTPPASAPPSSAAPQYSQGASTHAHSGPEYTQSGAQGTQGSGAQNQANPGYRPWEAEQEGGPGPGHHYPVSSVAPGASVVTSQAGGQRYYPYTVPHPHLPSFQSQFHFNENEIPPPNTQAPPGPPVPTTGETPYILSKFI